jgi:hypothetical protein
MIPYSAATEKKEGLHCFVDADIIFRGWIALEVVRQYSHVSPSYEFRTFVVGLRWSIFYILYQVSRVGCVWTA